MCWYFQWLFPRPLARSSQVSAITYNVAAADLWGFFEAKTIRSTIVATAAEQALWQAERMADISAKSRLIKANGDLKKLEASLSDDPQSNEGSKQLAVRAAEVEGNRAISLARYHRYELASVAFQAGVVLAFAEILTGLTAIGWLSGFAGIFGFALLALASFAPQALHLS